MSEQIEQQKAEGGNTGTPPASRSRGWCFTWNNYSESQVEQLSSKIEGLEVTWAIVGREVGKVNHTKHLQGALYFKSMKSLKQLKDMYGPTIHWETMKGNKEHQYVYCSKENDIVIQKGMEKFHSKQDNAWSIPNPLRDKIPRKWQQEVMDLVMDEPEERKIHWYVDRQGGRGKSTIVKWLVVVMKAMVVCGKVEDIKYGLAKLMTDQKAPPKVICWELPRSNHGISYTGLEQVKEGIFYNTKYECCTVTYPSPHVLVFANEVPEKEKLTLDRWIIHDLDAEEQYLQEAIEDYNHELLGYI